MINVIRLSLPPWARNEFVILFQKHIEILSKFYFKFYHKISRRSQLKCELIKSDIKMFCPNNETLQNLTEKTKLIAQKCSQQIRVSNDHQQVSTFKSYINEPDDAINMTDTTSPTSPINIGSCITANLTSLNRLIKERCSFMSATTYTCNTFPRAKPKERSTKWYIKVSL